MKGLTGFSNRQLATVAIMVVVVPMALARLWPAPAAAPANSSPSEAS